MTMLDGIFGVQHVEHNGEPVTTRRTLNFTGAVEVTDDPANDRTNIAVSNPTGGQAYGLLKQIDLTSVPTQTVTGTSIVVDGTTWWVKGSVGLDAGATLGQGLYLSTAGTSVDITDSSNNNRRWFLPFASIDGFNPDAPVAAWARLYSPAKFSTFATVCFVDCAASSAALTTAERLRRSGVGHDSNTASMPCLTADSWGNASVTGALQPAPTDVAVGLLACGDGLDLKNWYSWAALGSAAPNPFTYRIGLAQAQQVSSSFYSACATRNRAATGLLFGLNVQGGATAYLRHVTIMQPKVG